MLAIHTILHPTDSSEHSQYAFWLACALARDYGARLVVMHAITPGTTELLTLGTQAKSGGIKERLPACAQGSSHGSLAKRPRPRHNNRDSGSDDHPPQ
jgi:hypothetical protein